MPIVKCEECGRSFNLQEAQYGKVKCKCGAILHAPKAVTSESARQEKVAAPVSNGAPMSDMDAIKALKSAYDSLRAEMATVIVGQDKVVEEILIAIFAKGHCLLEGVPGLAKTLMIASPAQCLH